MELPQNKKRKGPKAKLKMFKEWSDNEELTKETEQTGREVGRKGMNERRNGQQCLSNHTGKHRGVRVED